MSGRPAVNPRPSWLVVLLIATAALYYSGTGGPFAFDDYTNATTIRPNDASASEILRASMSNTSGLLRRPAANFTFALNYLGSTHASAGAPLPWSYKAVNILIHLAMVLAVFVFARAISREWESSTLFALLCAAIFAAHPLNVSTVLYVTQRMTQLAALFSLLAVMAFFLACESKSVRKRWSWIAGYFALFVLAVLSKENGALVPLLAALTHLCFGSRVREKTSRLPYAAAVALPLAAGAVVLLMNWQRFIDYSARDYSIGERLLTQIEAIQLYAGQILLPHSSSYRFYYDNFPTVTSLSLESIVTVLLMVTLVTLAVIRIRRWPYFAFAVLWFFSAHSMESTVIPLEMVFEHRNYLPIIGPVVGVAAAISHLMTKNARITASISVLAIVYLAWICGLRVSVWSDPGRFFLAQSIASPTSFRANAEFLSAALSAGDNRTAQRALEQLRLFHGENPKTGILQMAYACRTGKGYSLFEEAQVLERVRTSSKMDASVYRTMQAVYLIKHNGQCPNLAETAFLRLADAALKNPVILNSEKRQEEWLNLAGNMHAAAGNTETARSFIEQAHTINPNSSGYLVSLIELAIRERRKKLAQDYLFRLEALDTGWDDVTTRQLNNFRTRVEELH